MARPLKPLIRGGGYYPSRKWTPLVYNGGYTTMNGGEPPTPVYWKTITGVSPLALANALAEHIRSLKQFGKCTQASTPAPSAPVNIVCNNGALKWDSVNQRIYADGTPEVLTVSGKNLVNITSADIEQGAISSNDGANSGSASHRVRTIGYYPVKPNTQYTISCVIDGYTSGSSKGVFILEYSSDSVSGYTGDSSGWKSPGGYTFTTGATTNFIRIVFAKGSSTSTPTTPADISNVQLEYGDSATEYEPYVEPQTITDIPMLLSVGDYKDEGEIISGGVTRRVGIKVFDGTENWELHASASGTYRLDGVFTDLAQGVPILSSLLCTNFSATDTLGTADFTTGMARWSGNSVGSVVVATSGTRLYACFGMSTVEDVKQYLAAQYAAGTPVIVVYPLAAETTEQTTPHSLRTAEGTNTVSAVSNVDPVTLSVEYASSEEE